MTDLDEIRKRLAFFYWPADVDRWLSRPHPQLSGQRPIDLINAGSPQPVRQILDRLEADAYL